MKQQVSLDIMQFVETQILPRYTAFSESHGLRHVNRVIKTHSNWHTSQAPTLTWCTSSQHIMTWG